jgi:hypothetical protein
MAYYVAGTVFRMVHQSGALVIPWCLAALAVAADGALELTNPDDVRARRAATQGRSAPATASDSSTSSTSSSSTTSSAASTSAVATHDEPSNPVPSPSRPRPPIVLPNVVASIEQGWYGLAIHNGTDASPSGGGSLATDYEVGYRIDAFRMTTVSATGRIGRWGMTGAYGADNGERRLGEALSAALQYAPLDDDGWWQASFAWARLTGTASTIDGAGKQVESAVDSRWGTATIERRHYPAWLWGVRYEDLAMPSAYSLDDPDGQVIAFFDTSTRWRTVSFILGIDSSIASAIERSSGWRPLYEIRAGLGAGSMQYDRGTVHRAAETYGYTIKDDSGIVVTALGEAALGVSYAIAWRGAMLEASLGGRVRASWYSTLNEHDEENTSGATYDALVLNSTVTTTLYGVFGRLTAVF